MERFDAIWITKEDDAKRQNPAEVKAITLDDLMPGDVTVEVTHTTVNYKDGLAVTGKGPVVRRFPMIPGIDFAGRVVASDTDAYSVGDEVILNGWGVGETHMGAYARYARVKGDWLIHRPGALTAERAMAIGTAGYTAMLCVLALENAGLTPTSGPVLVTGASGGVGSVAVSILAKLGYHVIASTGRPAEESYLKGLGAAEILDRNELSGSVRPLGRERWAGAVDAVGSITLANVLGQTAYGGAVAACGLAQGGDLPGFVHPFILRGVKLLGVDSVMVPKDRRVAAYDRLVSDMPMDKLDAVATRIGFDDLIGAAGDILDGKVRGRLVCTY
ncbi:MAG: oxidoreductase [Hyphomicrobiaceae bacterium]|nr:oxidoreductase [Hyphomicrobiaceae bacterium]